MVRCTLLICRGCVPAGYEKFRLLMEFNEAKNTGLLWMYILHTPNRCKKLTRNEKAFEYSRTDCYPSHYWWN